MSLTGRRASQFRRALLTWYAREHRVLPWRAAPGQRANPYHVLISEAMLQQTQVATVVDYFRRFVERFPRLADLAAADEQDVLRLWQGLGYYRRARNLHRAARVIVEQHQGRMPTTASTLRELPGVGRYTAGAIASIAFSRREPVVDGNVARVLARLFEIDTATEQPATRERLWELGAALLPRREASAGDFNQAVMELGATVCLPRGPRCGRCPVRRFCAAFASGRTEELPGPSKRRKPTPVRHRIFAVEHAGRYLFHQRGNDGLWAGLWELPTCENHARNLQRAAAAATGLVIDEPKPLGRFTHITTHRLITFDLYHAHLDAGKHPEAGKRKEKRGKARCWRRLDEVDDLPLANPQRRAINLLQGLAAPRPRRSRSR